jgi:uncharacterized alpha-E superfamily protein
MLSRAAEALFWIGRYAERAEDTARLLDVHFHQIIVDPAVDEAETCAVVATVMGLRDAGPGPVPVTMREVLDLLAYAMDNPSAIAGSLAAARENARGVRESLSGEIWECLNTTYLELPRRISAARQFGPAPFCSYVRHRAAMYSGYVASTISRDAGYDFLALGRSLERADMTARLLAAAVGTPAREDEHWVTTLRACSAHEAYLRRYQRVVAGRPVLEFLLLDRQFPRSVLHALTVGERALARLEPAAEWETRTSDARRLIGRIRTDLEFLSPDALGQGLPERLQSIQRGVSEVSESIARRYFGSSTPVGWNREEADWIGAAPSGRDR